jgi:hypothetical protein
MRLTMIFVIAAIAGAVLMALVADTNTLLAMTIGAGLGAGVVVFCLAFPRQLGNPDFGPPDPDD